MLILDRLLVFRKMSSSDNEGFDQYGWHSFHVEACCQQLKSMKEQLNNGVDVNIRTRNFRTETALHLACRNDYFAMVKLLVESKATVDATNINDDTPLMLASHVDVMEYLLDRKANINKQNKEGWTALMHVVAERAPLDAVQLLLERKADLGLKNSRRETAFDLAIEDADQTFDLLAKHAKFEHSLRAEN